MFYVGCITESFPLKSSLDNDPGPKHGFGDIASLPLTQSVLAVYNNSTDIFDCYGEHIRRLW